MAACAFNRSLSLHCRRRQQVCREGRTVCTAFRLESVLNVARLGDLGDQFSPRGRRLLADEPAQAVPLQRARAWNKSSAYRRTSSV